MLPEPRRSPGCGHTRGQQFGQDADRATRLERRARSADGEGWPPSPCTCDARTRSPRNSTGRYRFRTSRRSNAVRSSSSRPPGMDEHFVAAPEPSQHLWGKQGVVIGVGPEGSGLRDECPSGPPLARRRAAVEVEPTAIGPRQIPPPGVGPMPGPDQVAEVLCPDRFGNAEGGLPAGVMIRMAIAPRSQARSPGRTLPGARRQGPRSSERSDRRAGPTG